MAALSFMLVSGSGRGVGLPSYRQAGTLDRAEEDRHHGVGASAHVDHAERGEGWRSGWEVWGVHAAHAAVAGQVRA